MQLSARIILLVIILLVASCHEGDRHSIPERGAIDSVTQTETINQPLILLIYPDKQKTDKLKNSIGPDNFYRTADLNGKYFTEIRNFLAGSGISVSTSEGVKFRFISGNGAITTTDLTQVDSPWQVIIFNGTDSPVLVSPGMAIQKIRNQFSLPAIEKHSSAYKTRKKSSGHPPAEQNHAKRQDSLLQSEIPPTKGTTIRLILTPGQQPPSSRAEASGLRVVTSYISPVHRFRLIFENDIFSNTDRYYTNGVILGYTAPGLINLPANRLMLPSGQNSIVHASLSLHHAMYTPFTTKNPPLLDGDRPYASTLFLRYSQTSECAEQGLIFTSAIEAGVIGDAALGRYFQKSVHATVPTNDEPLGWETQIRNDIILSYSANISKLLIQKRNAEVFATASAKAGTLHTYAALGIDAIAGKFTSGLTPLPYSYPELCQKPVKWEYGIRGGLEFRMIGYDASLQGGITNKNNIYTLNPEEIERLVAALHLGIFARYRKIGINISQYYLSREIREGRQHFWGLIGLDYTW